MRIKVVGDNDCARATKSILRAAGFAVVEFLPAEVVKDMPSLGYVIQIDENPNLLAIHCDSVDCPLEANILRHVSQLSKLAIVVDRPGGQVHSDREIRIVVGNQPEQQHAVEVGVLRGILELHGMLPSRAEPLKPQPEQQHVVEVGVLAEPPKPRERWWTKIFGGRT